MLWRCFGRGGASRKRGIEEETGPDMWGAAESGDAPRLRKLLAGGASPNERRAADKMAPLCLAALNGHVAAVHELLMAGASVHSITPQGLTPLHLAAIQVRVTVHKASAGFQLSCLPAAR